MKILLKSSPAGIEPGSSHYLDAHELLIIGLLFFQGKTDQNLGKFQKNTAKIPRASKKLPGKYLDIKWKNRCYQKFSE